QLPSTCNALLSSLALPLPPPPTLFPYTTLFRSSSQNGSQPVRGSSSMPSQLTGRTGMVPSRTSPTSPLDSAIECVSPSIVYSPNRWGLRLFHSVSSVTVTATSSPRPKADATPLTRFTPP